MGEKKTVEVILGQQKLTFRTDQSAEEVHRAAELVNRKLNEAVPPGQPVSHQVLLLVAMNLADELLHTRSKLERFQGQIKERSERLLERLEKDFPIS